MTNIVVGIVALLHAVLAQIGLNHSSLPVTILITVLGLSGFVASAKLYERNRFHVARARKLRDRLEELHSDAHISELLSKARAEHKKEYPFWYKIRLYQLWLFLHLLIAVLGVIYTLLIIA